MCSIDSGARKNVMPDWIDETHLPLRLSLGRLDRSRFGHLGNYLEIAGKGFFAQRLEDVMDKWQPAVVHILPHSSSDFHIAWRLARQKGLRVVMSVHDDLRATVPPQHPLREESESRLAEIWREVDHVFVISQEMGKEYSARYGRREFETMTDGVEEIAAKPVETPPHRLHVYFMGSFHYTYGENFRMLAGALAEFKRKNHDFDVKLTLRCGELPRNLNLEFEPEILPLSDQATVLRDMRQADLLYLPLQFDEAHKNFIRHSLSTKMVTYLGSGIPILYHGPCDSAAYGLLSVNRAAFMLNSLDGEAAQPLFKAATASSPRDQICSNALELARKSFRLDDLRRKFRQGILAG
jgi:glycosyltransferase involved in cell wall biosynthesis